MTATIERDQRTQSAEALAQLPIGTRLRCEMTTPHEAVKQDENRWQWGAQGSGLPHTASDLVLHESHRTGWHVVELGTPAATDTPLDVANIANYPIGTVARWTNGTTYIKTGADHWERSVGGEGGFPATRTDAAWDGAHGWRVIAMFPDRIEQAPAYPGVGEPIMSREQIDSLPVGSVLVGGGQHYIKTGEMEWCHTHAHDFQPGRTYGRGGSFNLDGYNRVVRVGPGAPPLPDNCPAVGAPINSNEQLLALPVGSVIRVNETGGATYVKTGTGGRRGEWHYADAAPPYTQRRDTSDGNFTMHGHNVVVRVGPADSFTVEVPSAGAEQRVAQAMTDVRNALNDCVNQQRFWGWVRDGAFRLLGMDPMPAVDDYVEYGSAFGLPVGTLVRHENGSIYQVNDNQHRFPDLLAGPGLTNREDPQRTAEEQHFRYRMQVIFLGEWAPPVYTGRNNFIHTVWMAQRHHREVNSWCSAVESCLNNHELYDPGDTPDPVDVVIPPTAATLTGTLTAGPVLVEGSIIRRVDTEHEDALNALPVGSTVFVPDGGPGICVLTAQRGWVRADTVGRYVLARRVNVRIESIPGAVEEDTEEPF